MTIRNQTDGNKTILAPEGRIDTITSPELEEAIAKIPEGVTSLTLDLSHVDYVSSAGLRVLLATFKQMKVNKGSMELTNVGENFKDVLQNTGLDAVFGVF